MPKRIPIWLWRHLHSPITLRAIILVAWLTVVGILLILNYVERDSEIRRHNEILNLLSLSQQSIASTGEKLVLFEGNQEEMLKVLERFNENIATDRLQREEEHKGIVDALKRIGKPIYSQPRKTKKSAKQCYSEIKKVQRVGNTFVITTDLVPKAKCP